MKIIDTHCHYNLAPFYDEDGGWQTYWQAAQEVGVKHAIVVGTTTETNQRAVTIAEQNDALIASVGLHPHVAQDIIEKLDDNHNMAQISREIAKEAATMATAINELLENTDLNQVAAIGEIGLDYYHLPQNDQKKELVKQAQHYLVTQQLKIALKYNLPVILHVRDMEMPHRDTLDNAYWDMLRILDRHYFFAAEKPCILHCASGPMPYIKQVLDAGGYVSFAGNITYSGSQAIKDLLKAAPLDKILIETDAPYLPPQQYRGSQCRPEMIKETARFVLDAKADLSDEQIFKNSIAAFNLEDKIL